MSDKIGAPWWVTISYAGVALTWCLAVLIGTAYVVFWRGESGWWWAFALLIITPIKPYKWHDLWMPDRERIAAENKESK